MSYIYIYICPYLQNLYQQPETAIMLFPNSTCTTFMASIFALFMFLFFLLWIWRRAHKTARQGTLPPEAGGAWPVIGHLHLLVGSQLPQTTFGKMADKYGPIFTIRFGVHRTLILSSWEIVKECFTTNDKAFANRPKVVASEVMSYNYTVLGFDPYGPSWRQLRKIAILEVLSNHRLEMFKHIRESEVNASINEIYRLWVKNNKLLVEMKGWFSYITQNVIFRIIVGKRFAWAVTKDENEGNEWCGKAMRDYVMLNGAFVPSDALPYLRWLDLGGYERAMKKTAKELDRVLTGWLEEHKKRRFSGELQKENQDFMDAMLSIVTDNKEISSYDADTITKATCLSLIVGGTDTTTVTLTWILSLLLNNRETLKKAQQELDLKIGRERQVKESDVENLVYIQAIIKETMRLYPAAPISVPHESMEDCTLAGYHVPAGTRLHVNLTKLHRDPHVWSDPSEFRPERFLTSHKDLDIRGQNFEFIPFGSGRRICPGASFAVQVLQLTLAAFLHAFEVENPSDEPIDMTEKFGLSSIKATPLEVHLTPRLPAQAYASFY